MRKLFPLLVAVAILGTGCTSVDETEHCVKTRFGKVKQERMATGFEFLGLHDATCFDMTEQNFPVNQEDAIQVEAQTNDPITVQGELSLVYYFNPESVFEVFLAKRSEGAAEAEIYGAIREGYRNAVNAWSVEDIFSDRRAELSDSVRAHIQRKVGDLAHIKIVFVRDVKLPEKIEEARVQAARQAQILDAARKQFEIDSVNARAKVITAQADAEQVRLQATAFRSNPQLLQLEMARAFADGLASICSARNVNPETGLVTETVAATCIVGGSVADLTGRAILQP
jgi:regulator of protease activity HflC (stomatin/prohibitin superfamily)